MKVTHDKVGRNVNIVDVRTTGKADSSKVTDEKSSALKTEGDSGSSKVYLSPQARDIKKITDIALAAPDTREDRVAELQKRIDASQYKVDSKDIADKMVDEESQWT